MMGDTEGSPTYGSVTTYQICKYCPARPTMRLLIAFCLDFKSGGNWRKYVTIPRDYMIGSQCWYTSYNCRVVVLVYMSVAIMLPTSPCQLLK